MLITHFAYVRKYPEPHIQGVFDALKELMSGSFLNPQVLGLEIDGEHLTQFKRQLCDTFAAQPGAPGDALQAARP